MQLESYAKINWMLRVTGRRPDGFHDLETVFQTISLHDTLTFLPAARLSLSCDDPSVPVDETNLVIRAARALGVNGVAIHIEKRIPSGGGLGGGSSNAAVALRALSEMFDLDVPLAEVALAIGSDVPFFLLGGTVYATGRGEVLTPLSAVVALPLILVFPSERVLSGEAFRAIRRFSPPLGIERCREIMRDPLKACDQLINDFEPPIFAQLPRLRRLKEQLVEEGARWAGMTGSGSTIVAAFDSDAERDGVLARWSGDRAVAAEGLTSMR